MFKIVCQCGRESKIELKVSESNHIIDEEIVVDGDISISCGDWFIEEVLCECGNKLIVGRTFK